MTKALKLYMPSNGTEGMAFRDQFCDRCKKDINQDCEIFARTMLYDPNDAEYPREWVCDETRIWGKCTAFEPIEDS